MNPNFALWFTSAVVAFHILGPVSASVAKMSDASHETHGVCVDIPTGGTVNGRSFLNVESFNAIPYADPPVGGLRLKPPRKVSTTLGTIDGTGVAPACPQMAISTRSKEVLSKLPGKILESPFFKEVQGQEDCLTVNVQRPTGTKADDKLPVLFWMYGGGWVFGSTSTYDGTSLLSAAVAQKQPFIFVAVNYRVNGFGFMPGKEILQDGSANLGHLDQRLALEWVADNIGAFGGDREKVTLWGESAGSASVFNQMILFGGNATYRGKPLFRGGIMDSGTLLPADPVDCPKGQEIYDTVVKNAGCSDAPDTLGCLREVDYNTLLQAMNTVPTILSYNALAFSFPPRSDGKVIPDSPENLLLDGQIFAVPSIIGNQEDEGTILSLYQTNITTPGDMVNYLSDIILPHTPKDKLQELVDLYKPGLLHGSPFRTGIRNELYPGFKRVAAILGDLGFSLSRRLALKHLVKAKPETPVWSYQASYGHDIPILGTFHTSDIVQVFYGAPDNNAARSCRTYYFNFLYNGNPNIGVSGYAEWPDWRENQDIMWFQTPSRNSILKDDFRSNVSDWMEQNISLLRQ